MADPLTMAAGAAGASGAGAGASPLAGGLPGLSGSIPGLVMAGLSYLPSKEEQALRKQVEADRKRLAGGAGGMSEGLRQQAQANLANTVQAQQQQALAQLARGSAMGGGESGISTARQLGVIGAGQQAMMQGVGQLREQDLMAAQQQRALNTQQLQYLSQMEMARRQAALQKAQEAIGLTPAQQQEAMLRGQTERGQLAQGVQGLAGTM